MYTATIKNTTIKDGRFIVEVLFANDIGQSFTDTFETTQSQDENWIGKQITNRLNNLNSLPTLNETVKVGKFKPVAVDADREEYRQKASQYLKLMEIARLGLIKSDRAIITTLREWLTDNFKDEYIELF